MIDLKALAQKVRAFFGKGQVTGLEAFEFDTAGGAHFDEVGSVTRSESPSERSGFIEGWWGGVDRRPIHPGRIGGAISAWSTVVHTTDMAPGTFQALLKRWTATAGEGAGAHFLVGKTVSDGIVQLAPITRNANHAGGRPSHGWYKLAHGALVHPNNVAVGIELDNAGRLTKKWLGGGGTVWVHKDSGKIFAPKDVFVDSHGRGYERVTEYQMHALEVLLDALDATLRPAPAGTTIVPNGSYAANGVPEASLPGVREVGHWTLDPNRKTDPGPQVDAFLELRALNPGRKIFR